MSDNRLMSLLLVVLILVVLATAAAALPGCSRCSDSTAKATAPGSGVAAKAAVSPVKPAQGDVGAAKPAPAATASGWPGHPVDVLLVVAAPLLEPEGCDAALQPIAAALRQRPGISHVWTRASEGEARMLVRFAKGAQPAAARAQVEAVWRADASAEFGPPAIATMARGERALAAFTVVLAKGRQEATKLADGELVELARKLPGATATRIAGAVRRYTLLLLDATAMANREATLQTTVDTLVSVMATDTVRSVGRRLADGELLRKAGRPAAHLDKLLIQTSGTGEPLADAQVGRNMVTTVLVYGGHGAEASGLIQAADGELAALGARLKAAGDTYVRHNLGVARRFILTRTTGRPPASRRDFGERISAVLADGGVYGALAVDGFDGIPPEVDEASHGGLVRTLWLQISDRGGQEEVIGRVKQKLAEGGWHLHLLPPAADSALMWLVGEPATAGMLVSSRNAAELIEPMRRVGETARATYASGATRQGPREQQTPPIIANLNRTAARDALIPTAPLVLVQRLLRGPISLGLVNGAPVWLGLTTGAMAQHNRKLPLVWKPQATSWGDLQLANADASHVDRVRADGTPAVWLLVDSAREAAGPFSDGFWQTATRLIQPSATVRVQPLRLDQPPHGGTP